MNNFYPQHVQADILSACMEYKDLQSEQPADGNGIANADTQGDGISNPVEQWGQEKPTPTLPKGGGLGPLEVRRLAVREY